MKTKTKTEAVVKAPEKPTHADVKLTLEELYMLVGSVASFTRWLRTSTDTQAHRARALDYDNLLSRLDREYSSLAFKQGKRLG